MEFLQDSKTKPGILDSKNNCTKKHSVGRGSPRKCAEVYQCEQGGLTYVCLFCGEDFSKALQLEEHLLAHLVKIVSILDTKEHLCDIKKQHDHEDQEKAAVVAESFSAKVEPTEFTNEDFGVFIKTEPYVVEHTIEEDVSIKETWLTNGIKCEDCGETFNCQGLKNLHNRQKHNISILYDCQVCNATFNDEDSFKRHKEIHGILNNPTCEHCKQIFEFQSDLNEHLQQTGDAVTEAQNEPTAEPKRRPHICHLCGKAFLHRYLCRKHVKAYHNGEFMYCDICPYKAKEKINLIRHMQVHTKERPYSCDICHKKFSQSSYVKIHKRGHTGEKPYQCNICGLARPSANQLNFHIKEKHLNVPRKVYPCTVCDKKCRRGTDLKNHMRTHTGQKPFKCSVCNSSFGTKKILYQHKKIHESIKAYSCKYCGVKFAQHAGKRGHERRVHEGL